MDNSTSSVSSPSHWLRDAWLADAERLQQSAQGCPQVRDAAIRMSSQAYGLAPGTESPTLHAAIPALDRANTIDKGAAGLAGAGHSTGVGLAD